MSPFKITKAEALPIMRQAFLDGKLAAQNGADKCAYRSDKFGPCIVGCVLPDEIAKRWDTLSNNGGSIPVGSEHPEVMRVISAQDHEWFSDLQQIHDSACSSNEDNRRDRLRELQEVLFDD